MANIFCTHPLREAPAFENSQRRKPPLPKRRVYQTRRNASPPQPTSQYNAQPIFVVWRYGYSRKYHYNVIFHFHVFPVWQCTLPALLASMKSISCTRPPFCYDACRQALAQTYTWTPSHAQKRTPLNLRNVWTQVYCTTCRKPPRASWELGKQPR